MYTDDNCFVIQWARLKNMSIEDHPLPSEQYVQDQGALDVVSVKEILASESFEEVRDALTKVESLQGFREQTQTFPVQSFVELFELITIANQRAPSIESAQKQTRQIVANMRNRSVRFTPRVAEFFQGLLTLIETGTVQSSSDIIREKLEELVANHDVQALCSGDVSWEIKSNRLEKRFADCVNGLRALDRREGNAMNEETRAWRKEQLKKAPTHPPSRSDEHTPGVDAMSRLREGEAVEAIWNIHPGFDGAKYFKERVFTVWDEERKRWCEPPSQYRDINLIPLEEKEDPSQGKVNLTMTASLVANEWVSLPVPYTHGVHGVVANNRPILVKQDAHGDIVLYVEGKEGEVVPIIVTLAPQARKRFLAHKEHQIKIPTMRTVLSEETATRLKEIQSTLQGNLARAYAVLRYVTNHVRYLAPKNQEEAERFNTIYRTHPNGFAGAVDELREGDCDVVNTYFAALCANLRIPVRHVVGDSVKGRNASGDSQIHSGTGHAWSEVFDEQTHEWIRLDATPAGDSNLQEESSVEKQSKDRTQIPGDKTEQWVKRPTDEELEKVRKAIEHRKGVLSYTKEERELSSRTGVPLAEARQIVREIHSADQTRLPNGELLVDVLAKGFQSIIESRRARNPFDGGPVRRRDGGGRIQRVIRHQIGVLAKEEDPASRSIEQEEMVYEQVMAGMRVYLIGDKSGSMGRHAEEETLWQLQRRAMYLILSALHQFERNISRAHLQEDYSLSIQTQSISFRGGGNGEIDIDKPLSPQFGPDDKVKMWHSLTTQGYGNGDVPALAHVYKQIEAEIAEEQRRGIKKKQIRLVIACSDGGPDNPAGVHELVEALGKLGAVVVGMGLTESASSVPIIYTTPYSRGEVVPDINDLPVFIAKQVVLEAIKLFPEKAREGAKRFLETVIKKFPKPLLNL